MRFTPSKQFLFCCLAFIAGIGTAGLLPEKLIDHPLAWFGISILSLSLSIIFWSIDRARLALLLACFLFFGLWRYALDLPTVGPEQISFYNGQKLTLTGKVVSEPDERVDQTRYELSELTAGEKPLEGKLLLVGNLAPVYAYGDELTLFCKLRAPKDRDDFSYSRYLARYDIFSICYFPQIDRVQPAVWQGMAENFYGSIYRLKTALRGVINSGLPEPEASLANGMILGDQKSLAPSERLAFSRTGLSHIIAISGMNITIIAAFISWLILRLGASRRHVFYFAGCLIVLYIILIGAPASAVRAGLISSLFLLAAKLGRLSKITNALIFAGAMMLIFSPRLLRDDLGFILSFTAIFSLVFFFEDVDGYIVARIGNRWPALRQAFSLTIAAQVLTWPIMAYNFSQISVVAPLANLAALWTLPVLTAAVFLILPIAYLVPAASAYLFLPARLILKYLLSVAHFFSGWHWAAVGLDFKYPLIIAAYYVLLAWHPLKKDPGRPPAGL